MTQTGRKPMTEAEVRAEFVRMDLHLKLTEAEFEADIRNEVRRQETGPGSGTTGSPMSALTMSLPALRVPARQATTEDQAEWQERMDHHAREIQATRDTAACALCDDARVVRVTVDPRSPAFGVTVPCSCVPLAERAALAGIPELYREARLATMLRLPRKRAAIAWGEGWDGHRSAVIHSFGGDQLADRTYGTGKTHLVCALLVREIERGHPARFVDTVDLLDEIKRRFDAGGEQAEAYTARLAAEPLLAIDDVSAHRLTTEWQRTQVAVLIDRRHRSRLPTLITTNFEGPAEVAQVLGGALASRLREFQWIPVGGIDLRGNTT